MNINTSLDVIDLGLIRYSEGIDLQKQYVADIKSNQRSNTLLLMEHYPTVTTGRTSDPNHILDSIKTNPQIEIIDTDRGGQTTFHGPGQIIAYPLLNIKGWGGPHKYIRTLETVIMSVLSDIDIESQTIPGLTGVWIKNEKIAAIGVKISRGVAFHGFALNINTDLSFYSHIIPCGIHDKKVTSLQNILGIEYPMDQVKSLIIKHLSEAFDI